MQLFGISACKRGIPQINRKEVKYLDEKIRKKMDVDGSGKAVLLQLYSESNLINALPLLILDECEEYADIMIRPNLFIHSCTLYEWYSKYCDENILIKKALTNLSAH